LTFNPQFFDSALKELNDLFLKHVEREETRLFPKVEEVLSEETEEVIMQRLSNNRFCFFRL